MNYCTKCASYYHAPGTCNCFAPPIAVQPLPHPWPLPTPIAPPPNLPYVGDPPPFRPLTPYVVGSTNPRIHPITPTLTGGEIGGNTTVRIEGNEYRLHDALVQSSFTRVHVGGLQ